MACLLALSPCGCGGAGSENHDGGDGGNGEISCGVAEFKVAGIVDDGAVSTTLAVAGQALVNVPGDTGCYLNLYRESQTGKRLLGDVDGQDIRDVTLVVPALLSTDEDGGFCNGIRLLPLPM